MAWLRNLPISRKFTLAFGIVCGLCVLLGAYTFTTFHTTAKNSVDVSDNAFPSVLTLTAIRGAVNTVRREDLDLLLCQTPACFAEHNTKRQKNIDEYQAAIKRYESQISYPGERELYQRFTTELARYLEISTRANALLAASKVGDALDLATADATVDSFHEA
jgi:methyl-accepting chemotaxis protein